MSTDKFGRPKQQSINITNQQILIPQNLSRTDGSNQINAELKVGNNDIVIVESLEAHDITLKSNTQSSSSLIPKRMLDATNSMFDSLFDKKTSPMLLSSVKITTASEYHGSRPYRPIKISKMTIAIQKGS